jgi:hypothetical protein
VSDKDKTVILRKIKIVSAIRGILKLILDEAAGFEIPYKQRVKEL